MDEALKNYWDEFDATDQEESGFVGGHIAFCTISTGYSIYTSASPANRFFPAKTGEKFAKQRGRAKAKASAAAEGDRVNWSVCIRAHKDRAYRRGEKVTTWNNDQFYVTPTYQDSWKQVVKPSLVEAGLRLPFEGWCRIGVKDDPYRAAQGEEGKTREVTFTDRDSGAEVTEMRFPVVEYVMEVFADEAAAMEAVGEQSSSGARTLPTIPEGYGEAEWNDLKTDIVTDAKAALDNGTPEAKVVLDLADEFGLDAYYIQAIVDDIIPV